MAGPLASVRGFPVPGGAPLDLDIHVGDVVRVVGPNGSGKTSLLRALAGLDAWIRPDGVRSPDACGFAMQDAMDSLIGLTVEGEFMLRDRAVPDDAVALAAKDVATLSAGEARQVAVATASGQPLLLLDEPSEGLDAGNRRRLAHAILDARRHGAVVVADHGDHWAALADRTVHLGGDSPAPFLPFEAPAGRVVLHRPAETFHVAGQAMRAPALDLAAGFHALVGPNGAGKTQLLHRLLGPSMRMLPAPGRDVLCRPTVRDELAGVPMHAWQDLVPADLLDRHPWNLSGGEQQRVALAKVLGHPADVYLLDEPEAHLDDAGRDALHGLLAHRITGGACVLAATHDVGLIAAAGTVSPMEVA